MSDFDNNKEVRRKKFNHRHQKKSDIPEELKFISKSKKQVKRRLEEIKEEELWEDWEENI
jgi:hypothetical protein